MLGEDPVPVKAALSACLSALVPKLLRLDFQCQYSFSRESFTQVDGLKDLQPHSAMSFAAQIPVRVSSAPGSNPAPQGPRLPLAPPSTAQPHLLSGGCYSPAGL